MNLFLGKKKDDCGRENSEDSSVFTDCNSVLGHVTNIHYQKVYSFPNLFHCLKGYWSLLRIRKQCLVLRLPAHWRKS